MRYESLPIEKVKLDLDNPRIKQYLAIYKEVTSESIALALSGSSGTELSSKYRALRDSIKSNGGIFTPIIVNHITSDDSYIVIEGNTRLKFYQEFNEEEPGGKWSKIIAIVYDDMPEDTIHAIRLQAHMVGARDWDAYSKAKYLDYLYNEEKKPMKFLRDFCGGGESRILNLIQAYNDMNDYYLPACEEHEIDFDPQVFSYYEELQKNSAKDAIVVHGFDLNDFTKWVIDENLDNAQSVRKLARVLGEKEAREEFLKSNMTNAVKKLDMKEMDLKKLSKSNIFDLAKELTIKLRNIGLRESESLKNNPKYADKKDRLLDLKDELDWVIEKIEGE